MSSFDEFLGENVRAIRQRLRMKQSELARAVRDRSGLPFNQQTIAKIESGERPVRIEEGLAIADVLGVTIAAFGVPISGLIAAGNDADGIGQVTPADVLEMRASITRLQADVARLSADRAQPPLSETA